MRVPFRFKIFLLLIGFSLMSTFSFSQGLNGFNIQSKSNKGKIAFVAENSKIKLKLNNGDEVKGSLSGADSNSIYITRPNGKQKEIPISAINKITVFRPHGYFNLLGGLVETTFSASGNFAEFAVLVGICTAITAGELIVDVIADIANDEHYDLVNTWKITGPVVGR